MTSDRIEPLSDSTDDEHVDAVLRAAIALCGKYATVAELDALRAAVASWEVANG